MLLPFAKRLEEGLFQSRHAEVVCALVDEISDEQRSTGVWSKWK